MAPKRKQWFNRKNLVSNAIVLVFLSVAETIPFLLANPHIIAGLYVLLALVLRLESKRTFGLALIFLIAVPLLTVLGQQPLAEIYATLSYLFLVIGVLTAMLELKLST